MPLKFSRLSRSKCLKILECFAANCTATQTAKLVGIQRHTADDWYRTFREYIAAYQDAMNVQWRGEIELDESYFGGSRRRKHAKDRRKRGRGAENKVPVFGIKKREGGQVYTEIIENASKRTLFPIIKHMIAKRGIEPVVRDPWMVVWGNSYVEVERPLLLAAGFMSIAERPSRSTKTHLRVFVIF